MEHLSEDLEKLAARLVQLAEKVASAIQNSTRSLYEHLPGLAQEIIAGDEALDREGEHIEQEWLRILVIQQPVASDLRRIIAALKINVELGRMADLAVEIAEQAQELAQRKDLVPFLTALLAMAGLTERMIRGNLDAFARSDPEAARHACAPTREADRTYRDIVDELEAMVRARPDRVDAGFHLLSAAHDLRRIARHANNIAEVVISMKEGPSSTTGPQVRSGTG